MTNRALREGRRLGAALVLGLVALWFWAASANAAAPHGELVLILDRGVKRAVVTRLAERLEAHVVASIPQLDAGVRPLFHGGRGVLLVGARPRTPGPPQWPRALRRPARLFASSAALAPLPQSLRAPLSGGPSGA